MNSKSFALFGLGLSASMLVHAPAYATPEEIYPGTNAVTTEVEPYRPAQHSLSAALDIEFSPISYANYVWKDGHTDPKSGYGVHLAAEWLPIPDHGKLGVGIGVGLYDISKVGLATGGFGELQTLPIEPYISYRFDYLRHQILVPFVKVGPEATIVRDKTRQGNQTYYGINYTGGLQLCLDRIDKSAAHALQHDFGIYHSYLIGEYVKDNYLGQDNGPDLTRSEWRVGFRFEM